MVLSLILLHPVRERERKKGGVSWDGRRKTAAQTYWKKERMENADEGSFSLVVNALLSLSWIAAVLCSFAHIIGGLRCEAKRYTCSPSHA